MEHIVKQIKKLDEEFEEIIKKAADIVEKEGEKDSRDKLLYFHVLSMNRFIFKQMKGGHLMLGEGLIVLERNIGAQTMYLASIIDKQKLIIEELEKRIKKLEEKKDDK